MAKQLKKGDRVYIAVKGGVESAIVVDGGRRTAKTGDGEMIKAPRGKTFTSLYDALLESTSAKKAYEKKPWGGASHKRAKSRG